MPAVVIFAGCVIPDVPWILQRAYSGLGLGDESHISSAFFLAQASLAMCLLPSLALGCAFRNWQSATLFAWIGCAIHLVLDSVQSKWGNGVHLLAPLDWTMVRIDSIQVDSPIITWLTIAGLIPLLLFGKPGKDATGIYITWRRAGAAAALTALYIVLPVYVVDDVIESNSRYLKTLSEPQIRIGSFIELDREQLTLSAEGPEISTHVGDSLAIVELPEFVGAGTYSVGAVFVSSDEVRLVAWKQHPSNRDIPSYAGLALIGIYVVRVFRFHRRAQRKRAPL